MLVVVFGGAWFDVRQRRIPNGWILTAIACGVGITALAAPEGGQYLAAGKFLLRILTVSAVLFPLFVLRMIGAGDIKLTAVMVGYLGFGKGIWAVAYGCFVGAVLALAKLLAQRNLRQRLVYLFVYFRRLFQTKEIVPYYCAGRDGYGAAIPFAVCLLAGYLWYLLVGTP